MPYAHTRKKIKQEDDNRRKLTNAQRAEIRLNALGLSQRALAVKYKVSRRLIQFILYPDKHAENLERRRQRGGWKQYYDKEEHRESQKRYRDHKQALAKAGKLYADKRPQQL